MKPSRYLAWIAEIKLAVAVVLGLLTATVTVICHMGIEPAFRLSGLWLQLMGLAMTALGVYRTRLFFNQPGMFRKFLHWWKRAPWKPISAITGSANITISGVIAGGYATSCLPPGATTDERLAFLEKSTSHLHRAFWEEQQRTREMKAALEEEIAAERRAREDNRQRIDRRLEEVQTGGLGEVVAGLIWVTFGTILGGAATEFSGLYRLLFV